jgi:isopenicillin N synthase-like dioxygenase
MTAYFRTLGAMCDRMLPAFAAALDMPPDYFAPFFAGDGHHNLRFLHYPPQDADEDNLFGQAPHTDNSFMTALARTDVPGLAVRLPSGEWFPPPIIPGTFLINLGNMMRRYSNDRFLSTPHGVLNESGTDRYSIAYFHARTRTRRSNACRAASRPPTRQSTRRRSIASWCSNSTAPIISTRRATNPRPRSSRPRNSYRMSVKLFAFTCGTVTGEFAV